jgi:hypothetical protein
MLREKKLLAEIELLKDNIIRIESKLAWVENRTMKLFGYKEYFNALVNYLELDFEKIPASGEKINVIKKKR